MIPAKLTPVFLCVFIMFAYSCANVFHTLADNGRGGESQNRFVISFDKNGGDTEPVPRIKYIGTEPPLNVLNEMPASPKRGGYVFTGWNTKADGSGTLLGAAAPIKESCTVYAQWKKDQ